MMRDHEKDYLSGISYMVRIARNERNSRAARGNSIFPSQKPILHDRSWVVKQFPGERFGIGF
jgi:hypothetical protein